MNDDPHWIGVLVVNGAFLWVAIVIKKAWQDIMNWDKDDDD